MATSTDDPKIITSDSTEVPVDVAERDEVDSHADAVAETAEPETAAGEIAVSVAPDRAESVLPAEAVEPEESEELRSGTMADAAAGYTDISDEAPAKKMVSENSVTEAVAAPSDSFDVLREERQIAAIMAEPEKKAPEYPAAGNDVLKVLESLQDSLADTRYISAKIDAVSDDTERLIKQVNNLSVNYEMLATEMESITSGADTKRMLSKAFLAISSIIVTLLVFFQVYMFVTLIQVQQVQNASGSSVLENIGSLSKKLADYDKHLAKALEKPVQQEHAQPSHVVAEKSDHETGGNKEAAPAQVTQVIEKLNKLRSGLPEKKLIRKETGDWFVYNKKVDECIADVEVIETLNQAYRKIGRSLSTSVPMPSHNALCILKPDGRGGTQVVMTKDFVP